MSDAPSGQVKRTAAEVYEEFFVPALFLEWAPRMADAVGLSPGQTVLDVACGTGALTREAVKRVEPGGSVTGLDCNEGMLAVASGKAPNIAWRLGQAESLPFADHAFDAVVSQFGLMFFADRIAAIKEMWRVLRPGGRLGVAVWGPLDHAPGYAAMTRLLQRLFGDRIANELRAPFALGDLETLCSLFTQCGLAQVEVRTLDGTARFPSIESWVRTDVKGWTLADLIDEAQYKLLLQEAETELRPYLADNGTVTFSSPAHVATALKS
ncbi:MAG: methyltransferase domain-containing protein [Hyphomicrobium sp.]|uniref:methyltransferase domain-containing protein n=1 Tax=Hyphomicrobium sp. TaxID=82 RepID=UPI003D0F3E5C